MRLTIRDFWQRTKPIGGCLVWTGVVRGKGGGYGAFSSYYAHRWVYERVVGPIPRGAVLMHSCDNRRCVALQHLSVGSHSLNHLDAFAKGRKPRRGSVAPGMTFGRWIVLAERASIRKRGQTWLCRCECGAEKVVRGNQLRDGRSRSCGCLRRDVKREEMFARARARTA